MHNKKEYLDKGFKALEQLWRIRNQLQVTSNWKCVANLMESSDFCAFAINYRKYMRLRMFDIAVAYKNGQQRLLKEKLFHDSLREVDTNIQALQNLLYNPPQSGDVDEVDNVDETHSSSVVPSNTSRSSSSSTQAKMMVPKHSKGEPEQRIKRPNEPDNTNTVSWSLKLSDSFNKTEITIATSTASQHSSHSSTKKKKAKKFKDTKRGKRQQTGMPRLGNLVVRKSKQGGSGPWKPTGQLLKRSENEISPRNDNRVVIQKGNYESTENVPKARDSTEPSFRHFLPKLSVRGSDENMKSAYIARWAKNVSVESKAKAESTDAAASPRLQRSQTIHLPQIEKRTRLETLKPETPKGPESEKGLRKAFEFIKCNIGDRWTNLARHLPYTPSRSLALVEADIRDIQARHPKLSEQAYQSLIYWYKHSVDPVRESIYKLINTLKEIGEGRIAMHLKGMFGIQDQVNAT